jgi:hypothetical protein
MCCREVLIMLLIAITIAPSCATRMREQQAGPALKTDVGYASLGGGHYIKAVGADGESVTLEDGSVWEIDSRARFFTEHWQPLENITVRRTDPQNGFNYEIDNTDQDDGALARYIPH